MDRIKKQQQCFHRKREGAKTFSEDNNSMITPHIFLTSYISAPNN